MTTYAFQIGQVVNGNTITALPSGSGNYGGMFQLQRPDGSTFYDYLSASQLSAESFNFMVNGDNVNASNPLPVYIASGSSGGSVGTTSTPNVSTLADPTTPANQASVRAGGSSSSYALAIQGIANGVAIPISASALPLPAGAATAAKQPALGTAGTPSTDVLSVQGTASGSSIAITNAGGTSAVNAVAASTTVATALNANTARRKWIVTNDTASLMYVKIGTGASASSYSYCLSPKSSTAAGGSCEGTDTTAITVILASGSGNAMVTEVTA